MDRMTLVFRSPLNMLVVLAMLLSSVSLPPAARLSVPSVEWPRLGAAPVAEEPVLPVSDLSPAPAAASATAQPPAGIPADQWAAIQESIRRGMYAVSATDSGYMAANPAQRLKLAFDAEGLTVAPSSIAPSSSVEAPAPAVEAAILDAGSAEGEQRWSWGMALAGYGREGDVRPVPAAEVFIQDNRLTYSRMDASAAPLLDEWYINERQGLEQGFTLYQPPDAGTQERDGRWLALDLRLSGDLIPLLVDGTGAGDRQSIELRTEGVGTVLRYGELFVQDATGRSLPARLSLVAAPNSAGQAIRVTVDDANAIYPLVVDPLLTSQLRKLVASDGAEDAEFGYSLAVDGDTMVVGAYRADQGNYSWAGAAYVFTRNYSGTVDSWGQVVRLNVSTLSDYNYFGTAVAISGDTIAVGASDYGSGQQGAVFVFARNQGGTDNWGLVKQFTEIGTANPNNGNWGDGFGDAVDIDGDTIIVGAPYEDVVPSPASDGNDNLGAAYVFARNVGGTDNWGLVQRLSDPNGERSDRFGAAVAISGDTIIAGADSASVNGTRYLGAVFVFGRNKDGVDQWGLVKKVSATDGEPLEYFGYSLAIDGDTIVVGAPGDYRSDEPGAAYVFARNRGGADNWGQVEKLTAADGVLENYFGTSVAISGDAVVVGAAQASRFNDFGPGAAYVFARNQGGADKWGQVEKLTAADGATGDWFSKSVAISGGTIVVGAPEVDIPAGTEINDNQGAAYIFVRQGDLWLQTARQTASDGAANDQVGYAVAIAGDTIVVGAPYHKVDGKAGQGAAFVFARNQGGADGWGFVKQLNAADGASGDQFGNAVAIDGDTVVVGAWMADVASKSSQGAAYVFGRNHGGTADGWGQVAKLIASDGAADDWFGYSLGIARDTIVVGAMRDDDVKGPDQGSAYIFTRNKNATADSWGEVKKLTPSDAAGGDNFGASVAIDGDTVVVGASQADVSGKMAEGAAYIFARNQTATADNWGQVKKITATDLAGFKEFGGSVAIAGDTVVVGAPVDPWSITNSGQGSAYVFARNYGGTADGWGQVKKLSLSDHASGDHFGGSVAIFGDTTVVGVSGKKVGDNDAQGSAYVYARNQGGADNWGQAKQINASNGAAQDHFGTSVDITLGAIVVGAPFRTVIDNGLQGEAFVFSQAATMPTSTTVTSSLNPSTFGDSVTFTATVTSTVGIPTGDVTFIIDSSQVATATLSSGSASYTTSSLSVGTHPVTATYGGVVGLDISSGGVSGGQIVNKAATTTTLTSTPNPSTFGDSVTFTANVTSTTGTPTGVVTFTIDSLAVVTATLTNGVATYVTSTLRGGNHPVTATYASSANFNASTDSLDGGHNVDRADTTTTLTSVPNPSTIGDSVTFTATVTSTAGTPTGVVTFTIDSLAVVTATLTNGVATYVTSTVGGGNNPASVAYGGDVNFDGSVGAISGGHDVNRADTTTSLTSAPNPSIYGQSVTFTATVTSTVATLTGVITPTGVVTFTIDGSRVVTATVVNGAATYVTSTLSGGDHTASATYGGDANFNSGTGSLINDQTVNKRDTTTTVASGPKPSYYGDSVTFTATVTSTIVLPAGTVAPTGVVTFTIDNSTVVTATLSDGVATYMTSTLAVGNHSASVVYDGDANYNGSNGSLASNHPVSKATPTITWPDPADLEYGVVLDNTQLNATAPVGGSYVYTPPSGTVLRPGTSQTLTVTFTPADTASYNMATATAHITVTGAPDLSTSSKSASATVTPGETVTYTIVLVNSGAARGRGATVTDTLPSGLTYLSSSATSGTPIHSSGVITWNGTVMVGSPVTLTILASVSSPRANGTTITNTATIDDGDGGLTSVSDGTTVTSAPNFSTSTKSAALTNVGRGDLVTYTITLNNTGTDHATAARITDSLPSQLTYVSASASDGSASSYSAGSVRWSGPVTVGTPVTIIVSATVNSDAPHSSAITNTVAIGDGVGPGTDKSTTVWVLPPPVTIPVDPNAGGTLTGTLSATGGPTVTISFPGGAVTETINVTFTPTMACSPGSLVFLGNCNILEARTSGGRLVTNFRAPFTITVRYSEADTARVKEDSLKIYYFDDTSNQWVALPTTVDKVNRTLTTMVDHMTLFGIMGEVEYRRILLPVFKNYTTGTPPFSSGGLTSSSGSSGISSVVGPAWQALMGALGR